MSSAEVFVYTLAQVGSIGSWSRYVFPFAIDAMIQNNNDHIVRSGNRLLRISEDIGCVDNARFVDGVMTESQPFDATIQWPWIDQAQVGQDAELESIDLVGTGRAIVQIGYNQANPGYFTDPFEFPEDTLPGTPIPMPMTMPTASAKLTYKGYDQLSNTGNLHWEFNQITFNFVR